MPPFQFHLAEFYINGTIPVEQPQNTSTELASKNHTADGESLLFELTITSLSFSNTYISLSLSILMPNPTSGLAQSSSLRQSRQRDDNPGSETQYYSSPDSSPAFVTEEEDASSKSPDQSSSTSLSSPSPPAPALSHPWNANVGLNVMTLYTMGKSIAFIEDHLKTLWWVVSEREIQEYLNKESLRQEPSVDTEDEDW